MYVLSISGKGIYNIGLLLLWNAFSNIMIFKEIKFRFFESRYVLNIEINMFSGFHVWQNDDNA